MFLPRLSINLSAHLSIHSSQIQPLEWFSDTYHKCSLHWYNVQNRSIIDLGLKGHIPVICFVQFKGKTYFSKTYILLQILGFYYFNRNSKDIAWLLQGFPFLCEKMHK